MYYIIHDIFRLIQPGVAIGLAWTAAGGEVMFVEASKMGGTGQLTLTGQLGDVMKESATLALNWTRIHSSRFGLTQPDIMDGTDIHVHFPAGAVEKDGPSAGVTIGKNRIKIELLCVRYNVKFAPKKRETIKLFTSNKMIKLFRGLA